MIWWLVIFFKILNFIIIFLGLVWAIITYVLPVMKQQFIAKKNKYVTQQKLTVELEEHHRKLHQKWVMAHQKRETIQQKIDTWRQDIEQQNQLVKKAYKSRAKRIYANNEYKQELQRQRKLQKETLSNALRKVKKQLSAETRTKTNKMHLENILNQMCGE